jgi:hypothetical protein
MNADHNGALRGESCGLPESRGRPVYAVLFDELSAQR